MLSSLLGADLGVELLVTCNCLGSPDSRLPSLPAGYQARLSPPSAAGPLSVVSIVVGGMPWG